MHFPSTTNKTRRPCCFCFALWLDRSLMAVGLFVSKICKNYPSGSRGPNNVKEQMWYTSCVGSFSPSYIIHCINKTQHGNFCFFQSFFKTSKWHTVYCWTGALLSCTFRTILPHWLGRLLPWLHESVLEIVLFTKTHLV